jgi:N4-(beta-N-acetylglucosaminyl)-L-asparaginase
MSISRRTFLEGAAAAATSIAGRSAFALPAAVLTDRPRSAVHGAPGMRPVIISSANGIRGVARAYEMITQHGADPLDAAIAGVNIQELDPEDQSVGLGGLPNEDGVVQLDASVMHGPTKRAGAVGALEDIATPSLVAKAVMDYTDHIFLVGAGAKRFALELGFKEQNLLTEKSRQAWLRWKANLNPTDNWLDHPGDIKIVEPVPYTHGTINMNAVDAKGDIGSVTTTSGLSWKIPGRVGDSPIIGAGQYCDNTVGAAGSTGRGEANMKACGAFLAVELLRQGKDPEAALMTVIERVVAMTEARLLDDRGRPRFDLDYYIVTKDGRYAGASAYEGSHFAVADARGARLEPSAYMYKASERPRAPGT